MFKKWLEDKDKIILFDGGMGTEIIKRGISPGKVPDLLNIEQPEVIQEIQKSYYQNGSDMVQTSTFSGNSIILRKNKVESSYEQKINETALKNIKAVCPEGKLIVGDIGPTGEFRAPIGNATPEKWFDSFKSQANYLSDEVDLWHIETISDLLEMRSAIEAIQSISDKPIISSITFSKKKRGYFTIMGDSPEKVVNELEDLNVAVIGTNCTLGSNDMIDLAKEIIDLTTFPVSVKPNAGKPRIEGGATYYDQPITDFTKDIGDMINYGAKIVGGCCGTSPDHISAIRRIIDDRR